MERKALQCDQEDGNFPQLDSIVPEYLSVSPPSKFHKTSKILPVPFEMGIFKCSLINLKSRSIFLGNWEHGSHSKVPTIANTKT